MRLAVKPNGEKYYDYMLRYVDDLLSIGHDQDPTLRSLKFPLKKNTVQGPDFHLGTKLKMKKVNGQNVLTMTSKEYANAAIEHVELQLAKSGKMLPTKANTLMILKYTPELDSTPNLHSNGVALYQEFIGIVRWAIQSG